MFFSPSKSFLHSLLAYTEKKSTFISFGSLFEYTSVDIYLHTNSIYVYIYSREEPRLSCIYISPFVILYIYIHSYAYGCI